MAVYTNVADKDIEGLLAHYDIGSLQKLTAIAEGVENSNYLLETDQAKFILTLYEKRVDQSALPFYLGLMEHLADKGVPCPTPIHADDGEVLHELCGRPAAIVSFMEGRSTRKIRNEHCQELGAHMARMHLAGDGFKLTHTNHFSLDSWHELFQKSKDRCHEVNPVLEKDIIEELEWITEHWPKTLPTGVIHADLFPDNVFFKEHKLSGIIDFYFSCNDFLLYDVAIVLNAWCFESSYEFNITKAKQLLRSYQQVRPISDEELEALPVLASGAAMRFLLTRLHDWLNPVEGALVTPKSPIEYLDKLRFHKGIYKKDAYGL